MALADSGTQHAQAAVADDEGCQCLVRALDEMGLSCIAESAGATASVIEQGGDGLGHGVRGGLVQVATELVEGVPAVEGVQKRSGGERPDPVGFPVGEGVQEECVGGGQPVEGDDVEVRQDGDPARRDGRGGELGRGVVAREADGVGAQGIEAECGQAVVAAEVVEVVATPVVPVVIAGARRGTYSMSMRPSVAAYSKSTARVYRPWRRDQPWWPS